VGFPAIAKTIMPEIIESKADGRVLDPLDRNAEILFGLFMVLTFTGTLSIATAGREEIRTMLLAAIGCNTAWGFVDGVMYVLRNLVSRGRQAAFIASVRAAVSPQMAHRLIAGEIRILSDSMQSADLERIRQLLLARPPADAGPVRLTMDDMRGALGVFLLVFASTFPVVLPFVLLGDPRLAMRVSGAVAIAMLFFCGYGWGRYAGMRPARVGMVMVLLGVLIQSVVIALGG